MTELPQDLDQAIAQAQIATQNALQDGYSRLQVELVFPEIELQAQSITQKFVPALFNNSELQLKVLFPDTGAAALARRDWGEVPFKIEDLGSSRSPISNKINAEDQQFLVVSPSAIEVGQVEQLCNLADGRPVILLNPRLEDVAIVGIGYTARQLRERFLSTLESCYYLRPLEGAALFRCYPSPWQVWRETDDSYELITETDQKPIGEVLDRILLQGSATAEPSEVSPLPLKKKSFMAELQGFWRALTR